MSYVNLFKEAEEFLALVTEHPRLRDYVHFGNESCDNSYTIINAELTTSTVAARKGFISKKEMKLTYKAFKKDFKSTEPCGDQVNHITIMKTMPFDRSVGTTIEVLNEPLTCKKNKFLMTCIVNNCLIERIPIKYFRQRSNCKTSSCSFNQFTKRIYLTRNFVELHQLLQGKTIKVVGKTYLDNNKKAPIFDLL